MESYSNLYNGSKALRLRRNFCYFGSNPMMLMVINFREEKDHQEFFFSFQSVSFFKFKLFQRKKRTVEILARRITLKYLVSE